jgi:hypothetical protein
VIVTLQNDATDFRGRAGTTSPAAFDFTDTRSTCVNGVALSGARS